MKLKYASVSKWIIFIALIIGFIYSIESGYWWLFMLGILGFAFYNLWRGRQVFITGLKQVETVIWGKPLDKQFWEKGEMKHTKVKIVWKKKKENENQ